MHSTTSTALLSRGQSRQRQLSQKRGMITTTTTGQVSNKSSRSITKKAPEQRHLGGSKKRLLGEKQLAAATANYEVPACHNAEATSGHHPCLYTSNICFEEERQQEHDNPLCDQINALLCPEISLPNLFEQDFPVTVREITLPALGLYSKSKKLKRNEKGNDEEDDSSLVFGEESSTESIKMEECHRNEIWVPAAKKGLLMIPNDTLTTVQESTSSSSSSSSLCLVLNDATGPSTAAAKTRAYDQALEEQGLDVSVLDDFCVLDDADDGDDSKRSSSSVPLSWSQDDDDDVDDNDDSLSLEMFGTNKTDEDQRDEHSSSLSSVLQEGEQAASLYPSRQQNSYNFRLELRLEAATEDQPKVDVSTEEEASMPKTSIQTASCNDSTELVELEASVHLYQDGDGEGETELTIQEGVVKQDEQNNGTDEITSETTVDDFWAHQYMYFI